MKSNEFPGDAKERASRILNGCGGKSLGKLLGVGIPSFIVSRC